MEAFINLVKMHFWNNIIEVFLGCVVILIIGAFIIPDDYIETILGVKINHES